MAQGKKTEKKDRTKLKVILLAVGVVVILALVIIGIMAKQVNKIEFETQMTDTQLAINEDIDSETIETMTGYTNIALFGIDNRSAGNYKSGNSDTIMIASINNETKEVKLVSVYRDTLLKVDDEKYRKANYAFANGGAENAVAMLNSNLDLDISGYVCVDWEALVEVIDDLGGVDLDLTSEEVSLLNTYLIDVDQVTGKSTQQLTGSGTLHLDGTQALCYARIRHTAGDDFLRTSRQRIVLQALLEKAKAAKKTDLVSMCTDVFDNISTSLTLGEITSLASDVKDYSIAATTGFPTDLTCVDVSNCGNSVVPITLESNVADLHTFLFEETDYTVSGSVKSNSEEIINLTGVTSADDPLAIDQYNDTTGATGTDFKDQ